MDSRRGSNACSQSSLSSSASSITAARDLWRLRQTMHCLEQCNFYHGNLNRNEARERMRRCRPGTIKILRLLVTNTDLHSVYFRTWIKSKVQIIAPKSPEEMIFILKRLLYHSRFKWSSVSIHPSTNASLRWSLCYQNRFCQWLISLWSGTWRLNHIKMGGGSAWKYNSI